MIKTKLIIFILCPVLFVGCESLYFPLYFENTSSKSIDIEVLRPADTTLTLSIKKVLVFTKPGLKISIMIGNKSLPNKSRFDTISQIEFHAMADLLSGSPRFSILEPVKAIKPPKGKFYNWDEIDSICTNTGVDACLFLSKQYVLVGLKPTTHLDFDSEYLAAGYIWVISDYEFYSPKEKIALNKEVKTGVEFYDTQEFFEANSEFESLVSDYASENGEKFAKWIAPVWQHDTRNYYITGNKELESVKDLIAKEKWDEVFKIWRRFAHDENIVVAKHASYNSIISYEMEGKLDSALIMARDAYKRFKSEEIVDYGLILEERIRENELVNKQLGLPE